MKIIGFIMALSMAFTSQAWGADHSKLSNFIEELPTLNEMPEMKGVWYWNKPGLKFEDYDKFMLAEIEIFIAPIQNIKAVMLIR